MKKLLHSKSLKKSGTIMVTLLMVMFAFLQTSNAQCPPLGSLTTLVGSNAVCPGQSHQYTITPVTNAISYTWYLPPGAKINGQNPYTGVGNVETIDFGPLYSSPGNICVYATNGCATIGPLCKTLGAQPAPSGASNITGSIYACAGDTLPYSVTNVSGRTYNWVMPANATVISGQGTSSVVVTFAPSFAGGNMCVSLSNGCASSPSRCLTLLSAKPKTPTPIVGSLIGCAGQTLTYSTAPGSVVPIKSYIWRAPAGSVITGQGSASVSITFPNNFVYGDVAVKADNGCGSSSERVVRVNSTPETPGIIAGLANGICDGSTAYTVVQQPNVVAYNWSVIGGGTVTSGQGTNSASINYPPSFVSGKVCVTATNNCATGGPRCLDLSKNVEIAQNPYDFETCSQTDAIFTVEGIGMNLNYQWRRNGVILTDGAVVQGANNDSLQLLGADSTWAGAYDVIVSTNCNSQKTSTPSNLFIKEVPATPGVISGVRPATCPGTTGVVYTVPLQPDATGYTWSQVQGVTFDSGQGSDAVSMTFDSTIYSGYKVYVFADNECGRSVDSSSSWTRYRISYPNITGQAKVCNNLLNINYQCQSIIGADSYSWNVPAGASYVNGANANEIVVSFGPTYTGGDVTVTASNICFTTPVKKFATSIDVPSTPASITGQANGLCNITLGYTVAPSTGASNYVWTLPPGATFTTAGTGSAESIQFGNAGAGTFQLCVAGSNYCRTGTPRCIPVKAVPQDPGLVSSNPSVFCRQQSGLVFTTAGSQGAAGYSWIVPSGWSIQGGQGSASLTATSGDNNGNVIVKANNSCGNSGSRTFNAQMNCRVAGDGSNDDLVTKASVYPNPASDKASLEFTSIDEANYSVYMFDILGKKILTEGGISKSGLNNHQLDLSKFNKGLYIVSLERNNIVERLKLEVK